MLRKLAEGKRYQLKILARNVANQYSPEELRYVIKCIEKYHDVKLKRIIRRNNFEKFVGKLQRGWRLNLYKFLFSRKSKK